MSQIEMNPEYSARFDHNMQLQIDRIEWVLEKMEVNKIPNDRMDGLIRKMIIPIMKERRYKIILDITEVLLY